jgi:hypothetical protein
MAVGIVGGELTSSHLCSSSFYLQNIKIMPDFKVIRKYIFTDLPTAKTPDFSGVCYVLLISLFTG